MSDTGTHKPTYIGATLLPAEEFLAGLHSLVQTVKIHQENNQLVVNCIERFKDAVKKLLEDSDDLTVQVSKGSFFIQEEKVVHRRNFANLVENSLKYFDQRGLMGFRIYPSIALASPEEIVIFARYLNKSVKQKNPMDWLVLRFEESKLQWVAILQPEVIESTDASAGLGYDSDEDGGGGGGTGQGAGSGFGGGTGEGSGGGGTAGAGSGLGSGGEGQGVYTGLPGAAVGDGLGMGTGPGDGGGTGGVGPGGGSGEGSGPGAGTGRGGDGGTGSAVGDGGGGLGKGLGTGSGTGDGGLGDGLGTGSGSGERTGDGRAGTGSGTKPVKGSRSRRKQKGVAAGSSRTHEVEVAGQRSPRKVYAYALESMREVAEKISINQRAGVRNAVRIVQNMVEEVVLQEQPLLLAMSTIRVYDDYTFTHSVNVAILCMYLGKQIGVSKETMESLGISALFHDLGKVLIPQKVLNKEEDLTTDDIVKIRKHSLDSIRLIVRLRASAKRKTKILLPPFEHHLRFDLAGYPKIGWKRPISLCGRILTICDVYDALTSPRVYRVEAMSADRALGLMLEGSGTVFDPILLKVFINMLGIYPVGTLLELDNGDIGLVSKAPSTHMMNRPSVILLEPDGHGGFKKSEEVDLADKDDSGYFYRNVTGSIHPAVFNIQPAEFLTI